MPTKCRPSACVVALSSVAFASACNLQLIEPAGDGGDIGSPTSPSRDGGVDGAALADASVSDSGTGSPAPEDANAPADATVLDAATPTVPTGPMSVPYGLPSSGQAVLIGTNDADDITPASYGASNWRYSLFGSYGGGTFVSDYSAVGAYVLAAGGGHNHPPNFGAAVFDFADATWKRIDNANGMAWRTNDLTRAETNGAPNWEIALAGVTPNAMPTPAHPYMNVVPIPAALGGGSKGSVALAIRGGLATDPATSHRSHRFDLATGTWSRLSTNLVSNVADGYRFNVESPTVFDAASKRYYQFPIQLQDVDRLPFLDAATWTWKAAPAWPYPPSSGSTYSAAFLDPVRRLLVVHEDSGNVRAIDLANVAAGPKNLAVSGTLPSGAPNRWDYDPATDAFYTYPGSGQKLYKLKPPASGGGSWTASTVTIGGASLASDVGAIEHGTRHYTRFFFVPALGCFAWIAGGANKVALLRP